MAHIWSLHRERLKVTPLKHLLPCCDEIGRENLTGLDLCKSLDERVDRTSNVQQHLLNFFSLITNPNCDQMPCKGSYFCSEELELCAHQKSGKSTSLLGARRSGTVHQSPWLDRSATQRFRVAENSPPERVTEVMLDTNIPMSKSRLEAPFLLSDRSQEEAHPFGLKVKIAKRPVSTKQFDRSGYLL
ncbi:unnamed protein product [Caenorhabditis auriculariae]|uniref:Uncharacterized protein n=1 Tax=Caenorhabditis auriculariae TaxID=2777116 RepID=A0A8S1HYM1_9PELO|nr:unnamed protein product [Caenorhabditis auriculariae]